MSSYATPQEALTFLLQGSASLMPQITWGTNASPFYQEVPEPAPAFPYVWYDLPDSVVEQTFEYAYNEKWEPAVVRVYMREQDIAASASPYVTTSPIYVLDTYRVNPRAMDGANYQCISFRRKSWRLYKDTERGPDVGRVWIAEAKYELWFST